MKKRWTRRNFSTDEKKVLVQDVLASGLTPTTYAKVHGLNPRTVRKIVAGWNKRGTSIAVLPPQVHQKVPLQTHQQEELKRIVTPITPDALLEAAVRQLQLRRPYQPPRWEGVRQIILA